jgi:hypothetical protein
MVEFTREYDTRTHVHQGGRASPRTIPHLQTVEELMQKTERLQNSLRRIQELLINHAMEQKMKDTRRGGVCGYPEMKDYSGGKIGICSTPEANIKKRRGVSLRHSDHPTVQLIGLACCSSESLPQLQSN